MKKLLASLTVLALLAGPISASQAAIVYLNAGESATFNFDFTGEVPGPVYDQILVEYRWVDTDGADVSQRDFYSELDGSGTLVFSLQGFPSRTFFIGAPTVNDGTFSLVVTAAAGSFGLDPYAIGTIGEASTGFVYPKLVPEPSSLLLVGLSLAGLALVRRRKQ